MPNAIKHSLLKLYADDSLAFKPIKSPKDTQLLQKDLDSLTDSATTSQMKFNVKKCEIMNIVMKELDLNTPSYSVNSEPLKPVSEIEYHGFTVDNKLTFQKDIYHQNMLKKSATLCLC